jgi:hypothetical protein
MSAPSNSTFGPQTTLGYLTVGTLVCVWTMVWYFTRDQAITHSQWFWVAGLFFTGVTFAFLGLALGPLGRAMYRPEMPTADALRLEAAIQQAAAHQPAVVVTAPPAVAVTPDPHAPAADERLRTSPAH